MERPACDLCGANATETLYAGADWKQPVPDRIALVRCRRCGLMYLDPRPGSGEIAAYYPPDYEPFRPAIEDERSGLMRWMRRRKLIQRRMLIERYSGRKTGRVLDVGCATGLFLHEMELGGWQTAGVELAASATEYARVRFGLDVFQGQLDQAPFSPASFDVVTFWDVLEHTFSPSAELTRAARLLRPGGLIAINIPNWHSLDRRLFGAHWIGLDPPRHLYVFTRATLAALLDKAGLQVLDWLCFVPSYFSFAISLERQLRATSPRFAQWARPALNLPGARLVFEPWFAAANWLKRGGVIAVFARKGERA